MIIRSLGIQDYQAIWLRMKEFTDARDQGTPDEFWSLQHFPVFTQGQAGKQEHLLSPGDIPVVPSDRGGQVTYHGPGQLIVYLLVDLRRRKMGVRQLVSKIEQSVVQLLADYGVIGAARPNAPGVYVEQEKIASLGLRVRKGCSYHGLSLNVNMDLEPFSRINVCGHQGLQVTQLQSLVEKTGDTMEKIDEDEVATKLCAHLADNLGYTELLEYNGAA